MPRGRKRRSRRQRERERTANKRQKKSAVDIGNLVCPISWELPWDPVMAEDGVIYDRSSIEEHFKNHRGQLKSPMKHEKMGTKLLTAVQHRNTIEHLLEIGIIHGDLADKWNEKVKEKKELDDLAKEAEGGDAGAMFEMGGNYWYGRSGCKKDGKLAFHWFKRAHQAGHVDGTACLGVFYIHGEGVSMCSKKGMMYCTLAAGRGSGRGAFMLGMAFANGWWGMPFDKEEAIHWLEKCLSNRAWNDLSEAGKLLVQEELDELKASND